MKSLLKFFLFLLGLIVVVGVGMAFLTPAMDRWGATDEEVSASLPGDELVPDPKSIVTRAIAIPSSAEAVFPWLLQLGAERGGFYSYDWLETNLLRCSIVNADRIHPEWQNLQVGDLVKMCPGDWGPTPYKVALIEPNQALILGHQENGKWVDLWQFVLWPQSDGSSRLILRTRTMMTGGIWTVLHPGIFVMEQGMLLGIKGRASLAQLAGLATPTPEVFQPLNPPTPTTSDLPLTCQVTDMKVYIDRAGGYCFAYPNRFTLGDQPSDKPSVLGLALGSAIEPVRATFTVEVTPFDASQTLDQQADAFLKDFTTVDLSTLNRAEVIVGGETGVQVEPVPVRLSWRIIFVQHNDRLYRLMYWPVDVVDAKPDLEELSQATLNTFGFIP